MLKMIIEWVIIFGGVWIVVSQIIGPMIFGLPLFPLLNDRFSKLDEEIEHTTNESSMLDLEIKLRDAQNALKQKSEKIEK